MKRTPAGHSARALLTALILTGATTALSIALPATAGAYATAALPPLYSTAPGLPDGRVYEQVSPTDKNGNEAGAGTNQYLGALEHYALAAADGNAVLFEGTGALGETTAAYSTYFVAQRSVGGWSTRSVLPRPLQSDAELGGGTFDQVTPRYLTISSDFSHVMFEARKGAFATPPDSKCGFQGISENQIYLGLSDPSGLDTWLERPGIPNPVENCSFYGESGAPVGGSPDFSTAYFTYPGTLLPEDAARVPHALGEHGEETVEAWGFYEDREGALREAGVLPDGSLDPFGAVPAVSGHGRAIIGNQISTDGSRAFFVSPDPASCGRGNNCAVDPPELYVRENGEKTLLISQDPLLSAIGGLPAPAPSGVYPIANPAAQVDGGPNGSYVFAAADGSQAFFRSEDKVTADAPEGPPGNTSVKTYDFDVNTGSLTYLPSVTGQIVAANEDGSAIAFVNSSASPAELDRWSAGQGGGTTAAITQLPEEGVSVARMSSSGSVLVFMTSSQLPLGFNSGGFKQIYRYDATTDELSCVSCPPAGVTPTGNAALSTLQDHENGGKGLVGLVDERGSSADGSRIFFDTPDPLVPQDTDGVRDVYEWENGEVYLISSGDSIGDSFFFDNSESGGDVFFATVDDLVQDDTDGEYDVYDARIPRPGDNPPVAAVPCQGSVCQGPPRVPSPLGAPASATFSGLGNVTPEASTPAAKATPQTESKHKPKKRKAKQHKPKQRKAKQRRAKGRKASSNGRGGR